MIEIATKPPGILRPLLVLPLRNITRDTVAAWLEKNSMARPTFARRALACLGAFIVWAGDHAEYCQEVHKDACARLSNQDSGRHYINQ